MRQKPVRTTSLLPRNPGCGCMPVENTVRTISVSLSTSLTGAASVRKASPGALQDVW